MAELFSKVKQGIGKGVAAVGIKSKEVLESMKLKKQMDELVAEIDLKLNELGHIVYPMFAHGTVDQARIDKKCAAITELYKQLEEKDTQLNKLYLETGEALGKIYCSNCKTELHEGAKFCHQCGEKYIEPAETLKE
ncbi:MAG: zinc ribbon domain-containing protein [Bacillota bacterium]